MQKRFCNFSLVGMYFQMLLQYQKMSSPFSRSTRQKINIASTGIKPQMEEQSNSLDFIIETIQQQSNSYYQDQIYTISVEQLINNHQVSATLSQHLSQWKAQIQQKQINQAIKKYQNNAHDFDQLLQWKSNQEISLNQNRSNLSPISQKSENILKSPLKSEQYMEKLKNYENLISISKDLLSKLKKIQRQLRWPSQEINNLKQDQLYLAEQIVKRIRLLCRQKLQIQQRVRAQNSSLGASSVVSSPLHFENEPNTPIILHLSRQGSEVSDTF